MRPVFRHINQTGGDGPALIAEIATSWEPMAEAAGSRNTSAPRR
jgi:hypothetical protein